MPWIDKEKCVGCGICIEKCPVNAIKMEDGKAVIDMDKCIRCGKCHGICPHKAIRHDKERIPIEVKENLDKTKKIMKHYDSKQERRGFLKRMKKHFNKEKTIAEKSIKKIEGIENEENL